MKNLLTALNGFAVVFCVIWLAGHSTVRVFDWEFWFALGFLALAVLNTVWFLRQRDFD